MDSQQLSIWRGCWLDGIRVEVAGAMILPVSWTLCTSTSLPDVHVHEDVPIISTPLAVRVPTPLSSCHHARSDHTIQLPASLYYECRFQLEAGLFKTDPGWNSNTYSPGPRSWDKGSHVDK
jgi:hypothetical protein